jgi:hypothetical protein
MKKSKLLILGLIVLMLAGGIVLASCHFACEGAGTCDIDGQEGSFCTNVKCGVFKATGKNHVQCDC